MGAQGSRGRGGSAPCLLWVCCLPFPSHPTPAEAEELYQKRVLTTGICVALAGGGHRLCSRLLYIQVSCWCIQANWGLLLWGQALFSPPCLAWPPCSSLCPLELLQLVGPKGQPRSRSREGETDPRGLNKSGHKHRHLKKTNLGSNPTLPFPVTLWKLMNLSESSSVKWA